MDSTFQDSVHLLPYTSVWVDRTTKQSLEEARDEKFLPLSELEYISKFQRGRYAYWLYFEVDYQGQDTLAAKWGCGNVDTIQVWQYTASGTQEYSGGKLFHSSWEPSIGDYFYCGFPVSIRLYPGKNQFYIRLKNQLGIGPIEPVLAAQEQSSLAAEEQLRHLSLIYLYQGLFFGVLLFVLLFTLLQYVLNRERAYFYYAVYVLLLFCYFWFSFEEANVYFHPIRRLLLPWQHYLNTPISLVTYLSYMWFIDHFLNTKTEMPLLHRIINGGTKVIGAILILSIVLLIATGPYLPWAGLYWVRIVLGLLGLAILLLLLKERTPLANYVLAGTGFLLLGALTTVFWSLDQSSSFGRLDLTLIPVQIGILLELVCFSLGLGYKTRLVALQKEDIQQRHIKKLRENENLRQQVNQSLQTELAVLRNQLKPHFLFNSLSAIKNLIAQSASEAAEKYLILFARLMREVLSFSDKESVSLREELVMCDNYLKMEQLRFRDQFSYRIETGGVPTELIIIPPLILQPFLENAIKHGLLPKEQNRHLEIRLRNLDTHILCTVEDNGIGRQAASATQDRTNKGEAHGISIILNRIKVFNRYQNTRLELKIVDLVDEAGTGVGTRVELIIPH